MAFLTDLGLQPLHQDNILFDPEFLLQHKLFAKGERKIEQEFVNFKNRSSILKRPRTSKKCSQKKVHHFFKKVHRFEKSSLT